MECEVSFGQNMEEAYQNVFSFYQTVCEKMKSAGMQCIMRYKITT